MFYLIPPKGFSNLSALECDIETRFKYLQKIIDAKGDAVKIKEDLEKCPNFCSNLDCMIEGSRRDCASHFIFRLACLRSGRMQNYWIKGETELFLFRMKSEDDLLGVVTKFLSDVKKVLRLQYLTEYHERLLKQLYLLLYPVQQSQILFCKKRDDACHFIGVPWTYVEDLVSHREVHIEKGIANVPCSHFLNLLASLFRILLHNGIEQLKGLNMHMEDIRVIQLIKNIHSYFLKLNKYHPKRNILSLAHKDIEREVRHFPLCMQQLHFKLRKSRRLNHHERFRYSLFLKDIGLPLEENILFWKRYYSETPTCCHSGCQHIWTGETGKRFEYGIRHIYGMEGKRINYSSHSCSTLQALSPQPQECGGCPFTYFERNSLINIISKNEQISQVQLEAILNASKNNNPSYACGLYLSGNLHEHKHNTRQLARISSQFANGNVKVKTLRKSYSTFGDLEKDVPIQSKMKNSCSGCRFNVINPEMSFMSPYVYYHLRTLKIKNSENNNIKKSKASLPPRERDDDSNLKL